MQNGKALYFSAILIAALFVHAVAATSIGPNNASNFTNTGILDGVWQNASNAQYNDSLYAICTTGGSCSYLTATGFGFSIPNSSIINGIFAEVDGREDIQLSASDQSILIIKNGTLQGTNHAVGSWPGNDTYMPYGNSSDLWGLNWTSADINSANFGIGVSPETGDNALFRVNHIRMTVYYTPANSLPVVVSSQILNATNGTVFYNNSVLYGWANATDNDSGTLNYTYKWYLNAVLNSSGNFSGATNSTSTNIASISSGLAAGQNWTFEATATDGINTSAPLNSSQATISIAPPTAVSCTIQNNTGGSTFYKTSFLAGFANATSPNSQNITYHYTWYLNSAANTSGTSVAFPSGSLANIANISSGIADAQVWALSCEADDGIANSTYLNSTQATIMPNPVLNACANITVSGNYTLNASVSSSGACFFIGANNTVLDGAGYTVSGNATGIGVNITGASGVVVKNMVVGGFQTGIFAGFAYNVAVTNNTVFNNSLYGIYVLSSNNSNIANSTVYNNNYGIVLNVTKSSNFTADNITASTRTGIWVSEPSSSGNRFVNEIACSNGYDVNDSGGSMWTALTAQTSYPSALWSTQCQSINRLLILTTLSASSISFRSIVFTGAGTIVLSTNESSNTSNGDTGIILRNAGTVNVSVTVASSLTASGLLGGTTPSFQFWGAPKLNNSCTGLHSNFTEMSTVGQAVCDSLWYGPGSNEIYSFFRINVSSDAAAATRSTVITFTSTPTS